MRADAEAVPGGMPLHIKGLPQPLMLSVVASDEVLRVVVVVPEPEPHDCTEDGVLHDAANPRSLLPTTHSAFVRGRCELVSPPPAAQLEADRIERFEVVAPPGCSRVALFAPPRRGSGGGEEGEEVEAPFAELEQLLDVNDGGQQRPPSSGSARDSPRPGGGGGGSRRARFGGELRVPRLPYLDLRGFVRNAEAEGWSWVPLLTLRVLPQGQHIVHQEDDIDVPEISPSDPAAFQVHRGDGQGTDLCGDLRGTGLYPDEMVP